MLNTTFYNRSLRNPHRVLSLFLLGGLFLLPGLLQAQQSQQTATELIEMMNATGKGPLDPSNGILNPDPFLSYYPKRMHINARNWVNHRMRNARRLGRSQPDPMSKNLEEIEDEPGENDSQENGELVRNFGNRSGEFNQVFISGSSGDEPEVITKILSATEDDGSIPLANVTGINSFNQQVIYNEFIGDGPFGSEGTGTGDFDFYSVTASAGTNIEIDLNTPSPFEDLDPFVVVWDVNGFILDFNDDDFQSDDSFLSFTAPEDGTYYISIAGFGSFAPLDPFDSGSGFGAGSEGEYELIITTLDLSDSDKDFYLFDLRKGDLFGAAINGRSAPRLSIKRPNTSEAVGTSLPTNAFYPEENPLIRFAQTSVAYIAEHDGLYAIEVSRNTGNYELELFVTRSNFELNPRMQQTIFLDFNGSDFDFAQFLGLDFNDPRQLSPFGAFLENWGIENNPRNLVRITNRITRVVKENLERDLRRSGINPDFSVNIVANNGLESQRFEPRENRFRKVSKVIIGGTIEESGIGTIGIAQSIDLGNYDPSEIALVLLDILSAPATGFSANETFSINDVIFAPGKTIEDAIVTVLGNIVSHEAGHYLGNWHNDGFNSTSVLMDEGPGGFFNLAGIGPSGVFGASDMIDVDFNQDTYSTNEFFTGLENNAVNTAFALTFKVFGGQLRAVPEDSSSVIANVRIPDQMMLSQNYPNPLTVNDRSTIGFTVAEDGPANIHLYDIAGNSFGTLFEGKVTSGSVHTLMLDAQKLNLKEGVYIYKLETAQGTLHKKVIITK